MGITPQHPLTLCMGLYGGLQVLHCVQQAALKDSSTAALTHDPDAALRVQFSRRAAVLIVCTGLTQSPAPLRLILDLLSLRDPVTAGLC